MAEEQEKVEKIEKFVERGTICSVCKLFRPNFFSDNDKPTCPSCFDTLLRKIKVKDEQVEKIRQEKIKSTTSGTAI